MTERGDIPEMIDTEGMPGDLWVVRMRRVEVVLGLLLAAMSFAPWWTRRVDGSEASAWSGPHFCWLAVLLCLAVVGGRSLALRGFDDRWAAVGIVVALASAAWGWLSELAGGGAPPSDGSRQLEWVLQDQGSESGLVGGPFDIAWGYCVGLGLMGLLLAALLIGTMLPRAPRSTPPSPPDVGMSPPI